MILEYKIVGIKKSVVLVVITKQLFRNEKFFRSAKVKSDRFEFDGFFLISIAMPQWAVDNNGAYVRGSSIEDDGHVIPVPLNCFKRFCKAVEAYNREDVRRNDGMTR